MRTVLNEGKMFDQVTNLFIRVLYYTCIIKKKLLKFESK